MDTAKNETKNCEENVKATAAGKDETISDSKVNICYLIIKNLKLDLIFIHFNVAEWKSLEDEEGTYYKSCIIG